MAKIHISNGIVPTGTPSVNQYMKEVKKTQGMDRELETQLISLAQAGCIKSRNKIIESNLRFVVQVAKQYQGMGVQFEDLIGFGNIGLFEALDRFDSSKKFKFITYAVWYIRAEINKALNDLGRVVRVPSHKTQTEVQTIKSIHTPVGENDDSETYADRYLQSPAEPSTRDISDLALDLNRAIAQLKPKQAKALTLFYGIGIEYPQCMEQIAEVLSITGERARQLVRQAEKDITKVPGIKMLEQYL
jgi:RNA polymerase primary sigma factor